jgi:ABC-type antimicrobial peptide transport system permease subunit
VKEIDVNEVEFSDVSLPFAQMPSPDFAVFARTIGPFAGVSAAFQSALAEVDPALPVRRAFPLESLVSESLRGARFNALLIGTFAGAALLIAAVGIYGSMSRAVHERTREFGVRLALGASRGAILESALRQSARVLGVGSVIGLFGVLVLARVLGTALYTVPHEHSGVLYGISMADPLTVGIAFCALLAVAMIASAIPARHATKVDPLVALRAE